MKQIKKNLSRSRCDESLPIKLIGVDANCSSQLAVLGARPAVGKSSYCESTLLFNLEHLKNNDAAIYFSLEQSAEELTKRLISNYLNIPLNVIKGDNLEPRVIKNVSRAVKDLSSADIFIEDDSSVTIDSIISKSLALSSLKNIKLIVIDYLQLISLDKPLPREQQIAEIMMKLKSLAKEVDCTVLLTSQVNRAVEQRKDKRPILADFRESQSIEQEADMILFLYREHFYSGRDEDQSKAELILAKNRNGLTKTIDLEFNGSSVSFRHGQI